MLYTSLLDFLVCLRQRRKKQNLELGRSFKLVSTTEQCSHETPPTFPTYPATFPLSFERAGGCEKILNPRFESLDKGAVVRAEAGAE